MQTSLPHVLISTLTSMLFTYVTIETRPSSIACAEVESNPVSAITIHAGRTKAFVDVGITRGTCPSTHALANEEIDSVRTCSTISARVAGALIDILRAVLSTETLAAVTSIPETQRIQAGVSKSQTIYHGAQHL